MQLLQEGNHSILKLQPIGNVSYLAALEVITESGAKRVIIEEDSQITIHQTNQQSTCAIEYQNPHTSILLMFNFFL